MSKLELIRRPAALVAFAAVASSTSAFADPAADAEALAHENWRAVIAHVVVPAEGCYTASYPTTAWSRVECVRAPDKPYMPRAQTVGNGADYAAGSVGGLTTSAVGSFPVVTGVTSEKDLFQKNVYSIQLNSNFMTTAACTGHANCLAWEQFVYSSSEKSAFMQYWLINWNATCPSGWNTSGGDCWKNSAAVVVPKEPITTLASLKLSGSAVDGGLDTLVFTTPTQAYSTTGQDSVTFLATDWQQSEFNIIGDGGGSKATFNKGSHITVNIALANGTSNAPTCNPNAGTTGETNNLNLGACTTAGGATPSVTFTESN